MMENPLKQKYQRLQELLGSYGRVMVALSGGLDSSFLLYAATRAVGTQNSVAAIGVSASLPEEELLAAQEYCRRLGLPKENIITVKTEELTNPDYRRNDSRRCYFCKQELCGKLRNIAREQAIEVICDGANTSDAGDYRPGRVAAAEADIKSPLLESGLAKDEIRQLARECDLDIWDKPQSACLASRIPYHSEVTVEKLRRVEAAENFLRGLGFRQLRVRHHDTIARIELPLEDMQKVIVNGLHERISRRFQELGFLFTTIDLGGFKSGSMNAMLKGEENE